MNGWWRESKDDCEKQARYALVVSIRTDPVSVSTSTPTEVDLYTPVEILIKSDTKTTTTIETDDTE